MAVNNRTAFSRQLAARWTTATGVLYYDVCCTVYCGQECLYTGFPSRQTINACVCNELMSKLIGTKLSFQMNHASIWGIMMAAFVLNAAFQRALLNDIAA
ncbi:uncharacterized protein TNCV_3582591 [Trichonephila clavipes]|nr:uncharacterized protein TNCV_3582591 [Trichonephila clavipes]